MPFHRFVELVETGKSYLTSILLWEDPYETFIVHQHLVPNPEQYPPKFIEAIRNYVKKSIYAQSWTYGEESDALWRIYSEDRKGVRISAEVSEVENLVNDTITHHQFYEALKASNREPKVNHYKVLYGKKFDPTPAWKPDREYRLTDKLACEHKREAFAHEYEYRFSCELPPPMQAPSSPEATLEEIIALYENCETSPILSYRFPIETLKEVVLDPRSTEYFEHTFFAYCKNRGFADSGIAVKKSGLYLTPWNDKNQT